MKKFVRLICVMSIFVMLVCCASCKKIKQPEPQKITPPDDFYNFVFKLDGNIYKLDESVDTFIEDGWSFRGDFLSELDKVITPNNQLTTYLTKGDNWLTVEIINNTDSEKTARNCTVGRVIYDFLEGETNTEICTAGNFILNDKTLDDVLAIYGEPYSQAEYPLYIEVIYDKDPTQGIYDRYTFRFDKETKKVICFDVVNFY